MRYIIIPLLVVLYIWWSIISIKDLIKVRRIKFWELSEITEWWLLISFCTGTLILLILSMKYW